MTDFKKILSELAAIAAPPAGEKAIREYLKGAVAPLGARTREDRVGNLAVTLAGDEDGDRVLLAASVDEGAFVANDADEGGFIRFASLGDLSPSASAYSAVEFENGVRGTLVPLSPDGERGEKAGDPLSYAVDIGASSKDDAVAAVPPGTAFRPISEFRASGDRATGPSVAAKAGAAALLGALFAIAPRGGRGEVTAIFTSQGKVGGRSVGPAVSSAEFDRAVFVTAAPSGRAAGENGGLALGGGAAAVRAAGRFVSDPDAAERLMKAGAAGVTLEKLSPDATGATRIETAGVPTAILGIPSRYQGTAAETVDVRDIASAAKAIAEFARKEN